MSAPKAETPFWQTVVETFDSWQNFVTGLGTARDKMSYYTFGRTDVLTFDMLEEMYHGDDMVARIVDTVPDEMVRPGFELTSEDNSEASDVLYEQLTKKLGAMQKMADAKAWSRLYGGAGVLIGAIDGRPAWMPLDTNNIQSLSFLTTFDSRDLYPYRWYTDTRSPKFGQPETYRMMPSTPGGMRARGEETVDVLINQEIHESRIVVFHGVRTSLRRRVRNHGWSESVIQRCYEPLKQLAANFQSVSHLISDASQGVFFQKGLLNTIKTNKAALIARMQLLDMGRSVARAFMLDKDGEDFKRVDTNMSGLPDLLDKSMLRLAAAARMPVSILMGRTPTGLNTTNEQDIRWWYDTIDAEREKDLRPAMEYIVRLGFLAKDGPTGGVEPDWSLTFPPLWQMTPSEQAELENKHAQTDNLRIQGGVLLPEEITIGRFRRTGYSNDIIVDLDARKAALKMELERLAQPAPEPTATNASIVAPPEPGAAAPAPNALKAENE